MRQSSFSLSLAKFAAKAGKNADAVTKKVALDMHARLVSRSPVDTGRFRGNWQLTIGQAAGGAIPRIDKAPLGSDPTGANKTQTAAAVTGFKAGPSIWLVNNLPYGVELEYGSSTQAPNGMVRVTQREFVSLIARAAQDLR